MGGWNQGNRGWYRHTHICARMGVLLALVLLLGLEAEAQEVAADSVAHDVVITPADSAAQGVAEHDVLAQRLRDVFANIEDFASVQVQVNNGVVRLTGTVPGIEAYENVEALVQRFPGVLYVDNQLDEATDVETRVSPAIARVQEFWNTFVANLPVFAVSLLVLLVFGVLARVVGSWTGPFERFGISPLVHGLLRRIISTVLFTIGLVLALDILDVTALVGAVLGTAGVVGLALGFAFQDIVENYLAGVLLSVRQPFGVNDLVDVGEHNGVVIRLTARELVLMTLDGNHLRLPNATVFKSPIVNYTRNPRRRFTFTVGVSNDVDLVAAVDLGRKTLLAMNGILDDPRPLVSVQTLGDSNVVLWFAGWVDQRTTDFLKARSEALRLVKAAFDEAGYEMPEPIYRINLVQRPGKKADTSPRLTPSIEAQAEIADVSVDDELTQQVQEDLATSDEENLLEGGY